MFNLCVILMYLGLNQTLYIHHPLVVYEEMNKIVSRPTHLHTVLNKVRSVHVVLVNAQLGLKAQEHNVEVM